MHTPSLPRLLGLLSTASLIAHAQEELTNLPIQTKDPCPAHCIIAGPTASNWSVYHNFGQLQRCDQRYFLDFSVADDVDDASTLHRIRACTVWGSDWNVTAPAAAAIPATTVDAEFQIGTWDGVADRSFKPTDNGPVFSMAEQMSLYFANGYGFVNRTAVVFAMSGRATFGVFLGKSLQNEGMGQVALGRFAELLLRPDMLSPGGLAMQLCGPGRDRDHVFGAIAVVNGTFKAVQDAMQTWSKAECLGGFSSVQNLTAPIFVTAPPLRPLTNDTLSSPGLNETSSNATSTSTTATFRNATTTTTTPSRISLVKRATCTKTVDVIEHDTCGTLATRCNIPGADITKYNTKANFCATLTPFQPVCCSPGDPPDRTPKPNADGSCAMYTTVASDTCSGIAAKNTITVATLESLNRNTWGWNGCDNLWVGVNMCLSTGTPPMPAAVPNAMCGPQVPGTVKPAAGTDLSTLNRCLLNACCDVWGQCGTTAEFCTNTSTGAPGTAAKGTNGCISNCGTNIVQSAPPAQFRSIAYFEGYNLGRSCLNMDASQLDTGRYTHVHFAFATLTQGFQVDLGDALSQYQFRNFQQLRGPKRILSFGGWDFSTLPGSYMIFRNAVLPANRLTVATNIANFIKANNLDGVDIDWEYPSAPDIPGIPAASLSDGPNYLAFLVILKNLLPGRSVSIAAPASYWYLKGFPIQQMGAVVDYIVYMTYDLHGQWDFGNRWSDPGCPGGNCLRTHVNMTETINALVMITKAGVPSNKVVVGVTSYGRSFRMTTPGCTGADCTYTGSDSGATKGRCTDTAGYISDAEIKEIAGSGRVTTSYFDAATQTNILVYDGVQWVGYMDANNKASRTNIYRGLSMGGTTDWAVSLEDFHSMPPAQPSWSDFKLQIKLGFDPKNEGPRTGNWSQLPCDAPGVNPANLYPSQARWSMLSCNAAWSDAITTYKTIQKQRGTPFSRAIGDTFHGFPMMNCATLVDESNCGQTITCQQDPGTGPAGHLILNSMVTVWQSFHNFKVTLDSTAGPLLATFQNLQNTFSPVPEDQGKMLQVMLDLFGLGLFITGAGFFNSFLSRLDWFILHQATSNNLRDSTYAVIATGVSIAKDLAEGHVGKWTPDAQAAFTAVMGQVLFAWSETLELSVAQLFSGTDEDINQLWDIISDGKMIEGNTMGMPRPPGPLYSFDIRKSIERTFYAYSIPVAWGLSGTHAFVMDSGTPCGTVDPVVPRWLRPDDAQVSWACFDNRLYYIASPFENSQSCLLENVCVPLPFRIPHGVGALDGTNFGRVTREDIVRGSVRTFRANGNRNKAPPEGLPALGDRNVLDGVYANDIAAPHFIRLPVCGPQEAWDNWDRYLPEWPEWPCNRP